MPRPRIPNRRDQQLNLSLTQDEFINAYYLAEAAGMRLVDFGRWRLLGDANQPAIPSRSVSTIDRLFLAELKRLGNNLNQLARFCHATGHRPPDHLDPLLLRIRDLIDRGAGV